MKLYNLMWYKKNLVTKSWWRKQSPTERQEYEAECDMNERYNNKNSINSLVNKLQ